MPKGCSLEGRGSLRMRECAEKNLVLVDWGDSRKAACLSTFRRRGAGHDTVRPDIQTGPWKSWVNTARRWPAHDRRNRSPRTTSRTWILPMFPGVLSHAKRRVSGRVPALCFHGRRGGERPGSARVPGSSWAFQLDATGDTMFGARGVKVMNVIAFPETGDVWQSVSDEVLEQLGRDTSQARGLPNAAFTDGGFHELEKTRLFSRTWSFAAPASTLADPGDILSVEIAGHPLILVRGHDREVRAFHNVCPHRGARLVTESPLLENRSHVSVPCLVLWSRRRPQGTSPLPWPRPPPDGLRHVWRGCPSLRHPVPAVA